MFLLSCFIFFFFNDTATTEIYTLSLHDALPIYQPVFLNTVVEIVTTLSPGKLLSAVKRIEQELGRRSEEHTSELQSPCNLVCRLLLEKKKKTLSYCRRHLDHNAQYTHVSTTRGA